jgi:hypothetical protein
MVLTQSEQGVASPGKKDPVSLVVTGVNSAGVDIYVDVTNTVTVSVTASTKTVVLINSAGPQFPWPSAGDVLWEANSDVDCVVSTVAFGASAAGEIEVEA